MCGSHILAERAGEPHVVLRVATLDDDPTVRPVVHIWTSHDVPWLALNGGPDANMAAGRGST